MRRMHASLFELALQAQIEIGCIDADGQRRPRRQQPRDQPAPQPQQARQMLQHLGHAHHRQLANVMPAVHTLGAHARAADADEACPRQTRAQRRQQCAAQQIARGFARDQGEQRPIARVGACGVHAHGAQRTSGRWLAVMKPSISATSALSRAISVRRARASARLWPDMYSVR